MSPDSWIGCYSPLTAATATAKVMSMKTNAIQINVCIITC